MIVFDTVDGGQNIYRNAGWELPEARIALIDPGQVLYNEQHGALYYTPPPALAVGPAWVRAAGRLARPARPRRADGARAGDPVVTASRSVATGSGGSARELRPRRAGRRSRRSPAARHGI